MQLYWGFWSILQIGSTIAIIGVMLQFWIVLGDVETPSWAVALGTPVLVFAAAGFIVKFLWGKVWGKFRRNKQSDDASDSSSGQDEDVEKTAVGPWVSQASVYLSLLPVLSPPSFLSLLKLTQPQTNNQQRQRRRWLRLQPQPQHHLQRPRFQRKRSSSRHFFLV